MKRTSSQEWNCRRGRSAISFVAVAALEDASWRCSALILPVDVTCVSKGAAEYL